MTAPLSPERLAEIREGRYAIRSLAAADIDVTDLLTEVERLSKLVESMRAAVTGHDCPDPDKGPLETVVSAVIALNEAEKRIAELEKDSTLLAALEAGGVDNWEGYSDAVEAGESW